VEAAHVVEPSAVAADAAVHVGDQLAGEPAQLVELVAAKRQGDGGGNGGAHGLASSE
jgi:hypothetical protein